MRKWSAWDMKSSMTNQVFSPSRRYVTAGLGAMALTAGFPSLGAAQAGPALTIRARSGSLTLRPGQPATEVWTLDSGTAGPLRLSRGETAVTLSNELSAPMALNWLGLDGAQAADPLTGQQPLLPGGRATSPLMLRQPGTYLLSGLTTGDARPVASRAVVVADSEPAAVDRDEVLLIEEWRLKADGSAIAPGHTAEGTTPVFTINGQLVAELTAKPNERLRLRFINGCARSPVGLKIENHDLRVMAIDGAPAEPFLARDGQLVLAPGSRIDAFIDATRAPGTVSQIILHDGTGPKTIARLTVSNEAPVRATPPTPAPAFSSGNLPARLDLQGALRADLSLDPTAQWTMPAEFSASTAPAYRVKRGRTVVMAINNPTTAPIVFRLHGHHFRLLDRLDDGWKPFWLDTLMIDKGQTQRIAFLAEYAGRWLIEATALNWAAPKLVRNYMVE